MRRNLVSSAVLSAGLIFLTTTVAAEVRAAPGASERLQLGASASLGKATTSKVGEVIALASTDIGADGYPDLISTAATETGGELAWYRGNSEAWAPTTPASLALVKSGQFPAGFVSTPTLINLPVRPDFVAAGDFDADGHGDVVVAQRGGGTIYLLTGSKAGLSAPRAIKLAGGVDAMASGQIDRPDGQMDLAVAISSDTAGASLLTFITGLDAAPQRTALSAPVSDLAIGNLDDSPSGDVALLMGGQLSIWHGSLTSAAIKNRVESLKFDFAIRAMAVGNFIWDRDGATEVALLKDDGSVQFAGRGALDTRPFSQAEIRAKRRAQIDGEASSPKAWKAGQVSNWRIVESSASILAKSSGAGGAFLQSARLSGGQSDDLLVGDHLNQTVVVLTREGAARKRSEINLDNSPIALLPLQTSAFVLPSLVLLQSGSVVPTVVASAPKATFTVSKTADTNDGVCNADCSLREAIVAANAAAGADSIVLAAGTYTLTIANTGGVNEDASAQGDLDINDALTITGSGAATTIVQAGTSNANGIDKVFAFNPFCAAAVTSSISGVTVQFGRNTQPNTGGTGDFSETGGGIDVCNTGAGGFSAINIVVRDNSVENGYGGGINLDSAQPANGTYTITGSTISNNRTTSAASILKNGGGLNLFADAHSVTISNTAVTGNTSANEGGGVYVRHTNGGAVTLSGATISNNTAASRGGGVSNSNFGTASLAINNDSFVQNNISQGTAAGFESRGGGVFVSSASSTLIRETTITGNVANTGTFQGGGGIAAISGPITAAFNRIAGNAAGTGGGSGFHNAGATVTAIRNWWGCNAGPSAAPCDRVNNVSGTSSTTPHIVLRHSASPSSIVVGQTSTLTADFLTDSAAGAIAVADLDALIGTSHVFNNAVRGLLGAPQTIIQATGTALATFTAAGAGVGSADSVVDAHTQTAMVTIGKANTVTTITSHNPSPSNPGAIVTVNYSVSVSAPGAGTPTGNVTVTASGGSETCTGTVAAGSCNITLTVTGARTLTATYVGDTNFNTSLGTVAHSVMVCPTVVTNGNDAGAGSLRDLIANACVGSTLTFQAGVSTVTLTSAELAINKNLTIDGGNGVTVTRSAAGGTPNFRIFNVQAGNTVSINDLIVTNGNHPSQAGGILNSGDLTLSDVQISGNRAPQSGGMQNDSVLVLRNSAIINNVATAFGAGMVIFGPSTTLSNCTIAGNMGGSDSGGIGASGTVSITNCSIVGNQSTGDGSGIVVNAAVLTLRNSIVALNVNSTNSSASDINGSVQAASAFNVIGAGGSGGLTDGVNSNQVGVAATALLVGALGNYGGSTSTLPLLPGSVAINAGTGVSAPVVDQRGVARPQLGVVDIGAYESRGFNLTIGGGNTQTAVINTAFATPLSVNVSPVAVGEPVQGGTVSFTAPGAGASATLASSPATISGAGIASVVATANGTLGSYGVAASTVGNSGSALSFALQNRVLSADLSITKTDGVTSAVPGGSVTYTIAASNAGPDPVGAATVADTFPAALTCTWTCVGAGGGTCTAAGSGNINQSVALPVGGSVTHTASCSISAAATGTLSNTATVSSAISDPSGANNSATDTDTLTPQANLGITKSDGVTTVVAGGNTTYTITSSNAGPSNAPGTTVMDTFPAALTCTWTCNGAGGGTCTAAGAGNINDTVNLPSGASVTHTASCTISGAATGTLVNTATVAAGAGITDPSPGNNSATDSDTVQVITVSIDDVSLAEGDAGTTNFGFTASLSSPAGAGGVTFDIATANGTATAGSDYVARSLTGQTIAAGASTYSFVVQVNGDTLNEANETFVVNVSNVVGATVLDGQGLGTINNDDAAPTISVSSPSQPEGNAGTSVMNFVVSLSAVSGLPVNFTRATQDGTATSGSDYVALASAGASIPAGQQTLTIPVTINGDTVFEGDETFSLILSTVTGATPTTVTGVGTIQEDDQQPTTTTITSDLPDPSVVGQPYTVSVNVVASSSSPLGTVTISDGTGGTCGPVTLVAGTSPTSTASCAITSASVGAKTLTATYTPASTAFAAGTATATHQVNAAATTISVTGPASSQINTPTSFSFALAVTAPGGGIPAGVVTLSSGSSNCQVTVPTATPSCSLSFATLGPATVTAAFVPGNANYLASNSSGAGNAQTTVFALANLSISKDDGVTSAIPGDSVSYVITASNAGPSDAPATAVADVFPAACTSVTWTCVGAGGATCTASGSGNIAELVSLPTGASVAYTAVCAIGPTASGSLVNTASVTAGANVNDPDVTNNSATDTDALTAQANLVAMLSVPTQATPGLSLNYSASVRNDGPSNAEDVQLTMSFGSAARFAGATPSAGGTCVTPSFGQAGSVICTWIGTTAVGELRSLNGVTYSDANGTLSVTATASSATADPVAGNNVESGNVAVGNGGVNAPAILIPATDRLSLALLVMLFGLAGWAGMRRRD